MLKAVFQLNPGLLILCWVVLGVVSYPAHVRFALDPACSLVLEGREHGQTKTASTALLTAEDKEVR